MSFELLPVAVYLERTRQATELACQAFEALNKRWFEAWRNGQFELAEQLYAEIVPYLSS